MHFATWEDYLNHLEVSVGNGPPSSHLSDYLVEWIEWCCQRGHSTLWSFTFCLVVQFHAGFVLQTEMLYIDGQVGKQRTAIERQAR